MAEQLIRIGELPPGLLMAALGVVMLLDAIPLVGVLVPGDVAVLAVVGMSRPDIGVGAYAAVVTGCLAGWSVTYLVGRIFGDRMRHSRMGTWIGEDRWAAAEGVLRRGGGRMVLVAPFLPVFNALLPLAAGGLRMSYRRFLVSATLGAALWTGLYVLLGSIGRALGGLLPGDSFATVGTMTIGLLLGGLVLLVTRRRLRAMTTPAGGTPTG